MAQDMYNLNRFAGRGVAVREFPLDTGEADYLLFGDYKAIGVMETAKRRAGRFRQATLKRAFEGRL
jgi:type I restriction enzyme R subunit